MTRGDFGKKLLAVLFVLGIAVVWFRNDSFTELGKMCDTVRREIARSVLNAAGGTDPQQAAAGVDGLETEYVDSFRYKRPLIDLNGSMADMLHMRGFYSGMGMYVTDDRYIVSMSPQTSTDYEYEEMLAFREFLDERGIHLLYVNEPTKYTDDSLFSREFGIESYSNRNADLFLSRISEAGIPVLDLRESLEQDGMNIYDMFYRTDHHWTTRSGLWAAGKIAGALNQYCGYDIDSSLYDEENYSFTEWKECWLGEQGRKVALSYVGLDDYTEIMPAFPTDYTFESQDGPVAGTFEDFVDESVYNTEADVYNTLSWHYAYSQRSAVNNDRDYGKVLFLGDSYDQVVEPFLSLGVSEIDCMILRDFGGSLREYIGTRDFDTVIVCYAQFMIGAHDDPESANYSMFSFE